MASGGGSPEGRRLLQAQAKFPCDQEPGDPRMEMGASCARKDSARAATLNSLAKA